MTSSMINGSSRNRFISTLRRTYSESSMPKNINTSNFKNKVLVGKIVQGSSEN
jgi:hypothetical protein